MLSKDSPLFFEANPHKQDNALDLADQRILGFLFN